MSSSLVDSTGKPAKWFCVEMTGDNSYKGSVAAFPSYQLAQNARDILRDMGYATSEPRKPYAGGKHQPLAVTDFLAISACKQHIFDATVSRFDQLDIGAQMRKQFRDLTK